MRIRRWLTSVFIFAGGLATATAVSYASLLRYEYKIAYSDVPIQDHGDYVTVRKDDMVALLQTHYEMKILITEISQSACWAHFAGRQSKR